LRPISNPILAVSKWLVFNLTTDNKYWFFSLQITGKTKIGPCNILTYVVARRVGKVTGGPIIPDETLMHVNDGIGCADCADACLVAELIAKGL